MSTAAWSARDPLAEALVGLRSHVHRVRVLLDGAAPPVDRPAGMGEPTAAVLVLLGLISVCGRLERVFDGLSVPTVEGAVAAEGATGREGSMLR